MNLELSDKTFEARLQNILGVLCYVDYKQTSKVDIILLHEHLGLQNYVRVMGQALTYNQFSIIYPNLFGQAENDSNEGEQDTAQYLKSLKQEQIALIALSIIDYVAQRGKLVVLVGFSLGAAIGLKVLEYTEKVDLAFLFYGLPPLKGVKPESISAQTIIFVGSADKAVHLSDKAMVRKAKQVYQTNQSIAFIDLEGGKHGFMNPACEHYDEVLFEKCCKMFHKHVKNISTEHQISKVKMSGAILDSEGLMPSGANRKAAKSGRQHIAEDKDQATSIKTNKKGQKKEASKKQEDSGCHLY